MLPEFSKYAGQLSIVAFFRELIIRSPSDLCITCITAFSLPNLFGVFVNDYFVPDIYLDRIWKNR